MLYYTMLRAALFVPDVQGGLVELGDDLTFHGDDDTI